MSLIEKLHPASFRNVGFLVSTESVSRGKKTVMHEYPNSNDRYVEELGKLPPTFSITAIVHGSDAINQRLRLENVLEEPGLGLLVHPIYGRLNVKSLNFSVSSSQTEVGQFTFEIEFAQSRENITPEPTAPTNSAISNLAADAREKADAALESVYTPPSNPSVFNSFVDTFQNVMDSVNDEIKKVVDLSTTGAATFDRVYRTITRNISSVVVSAQTLRDNVTLFYDAALDAPVFVDQLESAWNNLLDYPLTIATSSATTPDQQQREQNNTAIVEHLRLTALANSYESKVYKDYTTDDNLTAARAQLNESYNSQLKSENETIAEVNLISLANDQELRSSFATLRTNARRVFEEKEKAVFRVVNITPGRSSMALTSYRYYGSIELLDQLIELNESTNSSGFNEQIKALTN